MTSKSLLAAVLLALMGAVWWVQLRQPIAPEETGPAVRRAAPATPEAPNVALHRLRQRRAAASSGGGGRDPFGGGRTADGPAGIWGNAVRHEAAALGEEVLVSAAPVRPRLELIGVAAARAGSDGRVAVLAGERGVMHARAGDIVAGVYRIERVDDDAIEVRLLPEDRAFTLRLR